MTVAEYNDSLRRIESRVNTARKAGESKKKINELRAELEFLLMIDYRLGESFPRDRREVLAAARLTMQRDLVVAVGRHVRGETSVQEHATTVNDLTRHLIEEFSRMLSPDEFEAFVGGGPDGHADPVDPNKIRSIRIVR